MGPVALEALYSVGPILEGIGFNITAWSYEDELGVSIMGCPRSVPDPWTLVGHLHGALDELIRAVADSDPRRPVRAPRQRQSAAGRHWVASGPPRPGTMPPTTHQGSSHDAIRTPGA